MIVVTDYVKNTMSVDRSMDESFPVLFKLKKALPTRTSLPSEGKAFEEGLVCGAYGPVSGYAIGCVSAGTTRLLSSSGRITNGGRIFVTSKYTCILYNSEDGFEVVADSDVVYEPSSIMACSPLSACITQSSIFIGTKPESYCVIGTKLFENYGPSAMFLGFPDFEKGVFKNGRLIGAFGISSGTWGIDVAPKNNIAARKSLLNKWRTTPTAKSVDGNHGVWLGDNNADLVINALQEGSSLKNLASVAGIYEIPASAAYGTAGFIAFLISPTEKTISKHWASISGICCRDFKGLDTILPLLLAARSEDDLKEVMLESAGLITTTGVLNTIINDYKLKVEQLMREGLDQANSALQQLCDDICETLSRLAAEDLDVAHLAKRFKQLGENNGKIQLVADDVVDSFQGSRFVLNAHPTYGRSSLASTEEMINAGKQLFAQCKGWVKYVSVPANKDSVPPTPPVLKGEVRVDRDDAGRVVRSIPTVINQHIKDNVLKITELVATFDECLQGASVLDSNVSTSNLGGEIFYHDAWRTPGVTWHEHQTHHYRYIGCDVSGSLGATLTSLIHNGWFIQKEGTLSFGNRDEVFKRHTRVKKVTIERVQHPECKTRIVMDIDTYYVGALMRAVQVEAGIESLAKKIVENAAGNVKGKLIQLSSRLVNHDVMCIGYENPTTIDGEEVKNLNPWNGRTEIEVNNCSTGSGYCSLRYAGHPHQYFSFLNGSYCATNTGNQYVHAMKAAPVVKFRVTFNVIDDLLLVDLPYYADTKGEEGQLSPMESLSNDATSVLTGHANALSGYANSLAISEMMSQLRDAGFLNDGVVLCGDAGDGYLACESLSLFTNFVLDDISEITKSIEELIETKSVVNSVDANNKPVTRTVFEYDGNTSEAAALVKLKKDFEALATASGSKAWFLGNQPPIFLMPDWEFLGWYVKL